MSNINLLQEEYEQAVPMRFVSLAKAQFLIYQVLFQQFLIRQLTKSTGTDKFYNFNLNEIKSKIDFFLGKLQSMNQDCVTYKETPDLFCEPYIHTGFRPLNRPFAYYFKSLFTKHNETINSLSHYAGALYCATYLFRIDFTNEYSWPFLTVIITAILMFVSSATAHLLHQKSHQCHMICFLFDFTGISIHGFSSAFIQAFYCSPTWYFALINTTLVPILGIMSMTCCLLNCLAQTNYKRPYPPMKRLLQFAPCVLLWSYTVLPTILHLVSSDENNLTINLLSHFKHVILIVIGSACFTLEIPQRFYPGKMDFFGQGHHLFHLCVFFGVILQIHACYDDYTKNYEIIALTRSKPTKEMCFLSVLLLLAYDFFIIKIFSKMIEHNFDKDGNLIK